jgi:hypothetical protein
MKLIRKLSLAVAFLMVGSVSLWAAVTITETPEEPAPKSEAKTQDPALQALRHDLKVATDARDGKLSALSPAFAAAKSEYDKAKAAASKDKQNPQLKQAQQDIMAKLNKIRSEELKKLLPNNADLKTLNDKVKEVRAKLTDYVEQQKQEDQNAPDVK